MSMNESYAWNIDQEDQFDDTPDTLPPSPNSINDTIGNYDLESDVIDDIFSTESSSPIEQQNYADYPNVSTPISVPTSEAEYPNGSPITVPNGGLEYPNLSAHISVPTHMSVGDLPNVHFIASGSEYQYPLPYSQFEYSTQNSSFMSAQSNGSLQLNQSLYSGPISVPTSDPPPTYYTPNVQICQPTTPVSVPMSSPDLFHYTSPEPIQKKRKLFTIYHTPPPPEPEIRKEQDHINPMSVGVGLIAQPYTYPPSVTHIMDNQPIPSVPDNSVPPVEPIAGIITNINNNNPQPPKRNTVSSNKRGKKHFQGSIDDDLEKAALLNSFEATGLHVYLQPNGKRKCLVIDEDRFYNWIILQRPGYGIEKASLFEKLNKSRTCNRVNPKDKGPKMKIKFLRIDTNPQDFSPVVSAEIDRIRKEDYYKNCRLRIYSHRDWGYIEESHFYYTAGTKSKN